MIVPLTQVLSQSLLMRINEIFAQANFIDGRLSAGLLAAPVKNNLELVTQQDYYQELNQLVLENLFQHPLYQAVAMPLRISSPLYIKYRPNMYYGPHVDNPIMGKGQMYRCDMACTIFLNQSEDYVGGELCIKNPCGETCFKLNAGDALMYPATSVHSVNPISQGERRVAVVWIQSMIRAAEQREVLFNVHQLREKLMNQQMGEPASQQLEWVYANLVRMWAQL